MEWKKQLKHYIVKTFTAFYLFSLVLTTAQPIISYADDDESSDAQTEESSGNPSIDGAKGNQQEYIKVAQGKEGNVFDNNPDDDAKPKDYQMLGVYLSNFFVPYGTTFSSTFGQGNKVKVDSEMEEAMTDALTNLTDMDEKMVKNIISRVVGNMVDPLSKGSGAKPQQLFFGKLDGKSGNGETGYLKARGNSRAMPADYYDFMAIMLGDEATIDLMKDRLKLKDSDKVAIYWGEDQRVVGTFSLDPKKPTPFQSAMSVAYKHANMDNTINNAFMGHGDKPTLDEAEGKADEESDSEESSDESGEDKKDDKKDDKADDEKSDVQKSATGKFGGTAKDIVNNVYRQSMYGWKMYADAFGNILVDEGATRTVILPAVMNPMIYGDLDSKGSLKGTVIGEKTSVPFNNIPGMQYASAGTVKKADNGKTTVAHPDQKWVEDHTEPSSSIGSGLRLFNGANKVNKDGNLVEAIKGSFLFRMTEHRAMPISVQKDQDDKNNIVWDSNNDGLKELFTNVGYNNLENLLDQITYKHFMTEWNPSQEKYMAVNITPFSKDGVRVKKLNYGDILPQSGRMLIVKERDFPTLKVTGKAEKKGMGDWDKVETPNKVRKALSSKEKNPVWITAKDDNSAGENTFVLLNYNMPVNSIIGTVHGTPIPAKYPFGYNFSTNSSDEYVHLPNSGLTTTTMPTYTKLYDAEATGGVEEALAGEYESMFESGSVASKVRDVVGEPVEDASKALQMDLSKDMGKEVGISLYTDIVLKSTLPWNSDNAEGNLPIPEAAIGFANVPEFSMKNVAVVEGGDEEEGMSISVKKANELMDLSFNWLSPANGSSYIATWFHNKMAAILSSIHSRLTGANSSSYLTGAGIYKEPNNFIYQPKLGDMSFTAKIKDNYDKYAVYLIMLIFMSVALYVIRGDYSIQKGILQFLLFCLCIGLPVRMIDTVVGVSNQLSTSFFTQKFNYFSIFQLENSAITIEKAASGELEQEQDGYAAPQEDTPSDDESASEDTSADDSEDAEETEEENGESTTTDTVQDTETANEDDSSSSGSEEEEEKKKNKDKADKADEDSEAPDDSSDTESSHSAPSENLKARDGNKLERVNFKALPQDRDADEADYENLVTKFSNNENASGVTVRWMLPRRDNFNGFLVQAFNRQLQLSDFTFGLLNAGSLKNNSHQQIRGVANNLYVTRQLSDVTAESRTRYHNVLGDGQEHAVNDYHSVLDNSPKELADPVRQYVDDDNESTLKWKESKGFVNPSDNGNKGFADTHKRAVAVLSSQDMAGAVQRHVRRGNITPQTFYGIPSEEFNATKAGYAKDDNAMRTLINQGGNKDTQSDEEADAFAELNLDIPRVTGTGLYALFAESPYYHFSWLLMDNGMPSEFGTTGHTKDLLLTDGEKSFFYNKKINKGEAGYDEIKDFADLSTLFNVTIPYLHEMNKEYQDFVDRYGLHMYEHIPLTGPKVNKIALDDPDYYKYWYNYNLARLQNQYTAWVDFMYASDYAKPEKIKYAGREFTVKDPLNPESYLAKDKNGNIQGRPMIFSKSEMAYYGLEEGNLTAVEQRIIKFNDDARMAILPLMNYYSFHDSTMTSVIAMTITFEFNKAFSQTGLFGQKGQLVLEPQSWSTGDFSYDAYLRLILANSTGESLNFIKGKGTNKERGEYEVNAGDEVDKQESGLATNYDDFSTTVNGNIYDRILANTNIFVGIMIVISDIFTLWVLSLLRFAFMIGLLLLSVMILIVMILSPEAKAPKILKKGIVYPLLKITVANIGFAFVISRMLSSGYDAVTGTLDSSINLGVGATITFILLLEILLILLYWNTLRRMGMDVVRMGEVGFNAIRYVGSIGVNFGQGMMGTFRQNFGMFSPMQSSLSNDDLYGGKTPKFASHGNSQPSHHQSSSSTTSHKRQLTNKFRSNKKRQETSQNVFNEAMKRGRERMTKEEQNRRQAKEKGDATNHTTVNNNSANQTFNDSMNRGTASTHHETHHQSTKFENKASSETNRAVSNADKKKASSFSENIKKGHHNDDLGK